MPAHGEATERPSLKWGELRTGTPLDLGRGQWQLLAGAVVWRGRLIGAWGGPPDVNLWLAGIAVAHGGLFLREDVGPCSLAWRFV